MFDNQYEDEHVVAPLLRYKIQIVGTQKIFVQSVSGQHQYPPATLGAYLLLAAAWYEFCQDQAAFKGDSESSGDTKGQNGHDENAFWFIINWKCSSDFPLFYMLV